jgi:hypothetical protein
MSIDEGPPFFCHILPLSHKKLERPEKLLQALLITQISKQDYSDFP